MDALPPDFDFLGPEFEYIANFRFSRDEIHWLGPHLHLPEVIVHQHAGRVSRFKGLCLVLYRLAWPNRFTEAVPLFNMKASALSTFFNFIIAMIYRRWKHLLLWDHVRLSSEFLTRCSQVVQDKGALLQETFGFLDGTAVRICRPMVDQEEFYSGYKKYHCIKYQAITTPDGMIIHVGGPFVGRHNDSGMLIRSQIRHYLAAHARSLGGHQLVAYGDEGYGQSDEVQAPFRGNNLTPEQEAQNASMKRPRLAVEWSFGFISNRFGLLNHYQKLRIGKSPVGLYFPVAALFSNLLHCFGRHDTTQSYFGMRPPTPQQYLTPRREWDATRIVHIVPDYFQALE